MKNFILGWDNRIKDATVTSSATYEVDLPLSNASNHQLSKVARTTTDALFTITIDLTSLTYRGVGVIALANHNLSRLATLSIDFYNTAVSAITPFLSTGAISPWPYLAQGNRHWDAINFSYSIIDEKRISEQVPTFIYPLETNLKADKIIITIDDTGNTNTYIEFGRIFVGQSFSPTRGAEYGDVSISMVDFSEIEQTKHRSKFFYKYGLIRTSTIAWKKLFDFEASEILGIQWNVGLTGEIIFTKGVPSYHLIGGVLVPSSIWFDNAFLGNLTSIDALTFINYAQYSNGFTIEEVAI